MPGDRVTFAFIPGAGIYPGVWRWTIAELQQRGHRGLVPWLPLDDPDAGPSAHADAVVAAIGEVWERPVVVGQSLGAFAAPLVAARIELAELVLVAPMIPAPGETAGEWWGAVGHPGGHLPMLARPAELAERLLATGQRRSSP